MSYDMKGFKPQALDALASADSAAAFALSNYVIMRDVLDPEFCKTCATAIDGAALIKVEHASRRGTTRFLTLNGEELIGVIPSLGEIYVGLAPLVSKLTGLKLQPLSDLGIGVSLNYTQEQGAFVAHFDRNSVTVSLYLNDFKGGALLLWPKSNPSILTRIGRLGRVIALWLTGLQKPVPVAAEQGTMVIFTDRMAHGVDTITGSGGRLSVILAYAKAGEDYGKDRPYYGRGQQREIVAIREG